MGNKGNKNKSGANTLPTMGEDTVGTIFESGYTEGDTYNSDTGEYNSLEDRINAESELVQLAYDMKNNDSDFTDEAYQLAIDWLEDNLDMFEDYEIHDLNGSRDGLKNELSSIMDEILLERE